MLCMPGHPRHEWQDMTATEAFEDHFKRDSNDPSCEYEYRLWCQAWEAATAQESQACKKECMLRFAAAISNRGEP